MEYSDKKYKPKAYYFGFNGGLSGCFAGLCRPVWEHSSFPERMWHSFPGGDNGGEVCVCGALSERGLSFSDPNGRAPWCVCLWVCMCVFVELCAGSG